MTRKALVQRELKRVKTVERFAQKRAVLKKIINDSNATYEEKNEARRQDLKPKAYIRSGSIYCMKRSYLMDLNLRYGGSNSRPYILPSERAVNVDTEIDFIVCERLMSQLIHPYQTQLDLE